MAEAYFVQGGSYLRYDLEITFEESAEGTETNIVIPREETCETCSGSGAAPGSTRRMRSPRSAAARTLRRWMALEARMPSAAL